MYKNTPEDMEEQYTLGLRLCNPRKVDISQPPYAAQVQMAVQLYNESQSTASNPKRLELLQIKGNQMVVQLFSTNPLEKPGKALRYFSQVLVKNHIFSSLVYNGHMFDSFPVVDMQHSEQEEEILIPVDTIDDVTFLQALLAFCMENRGSNTQGRTAVTEMKRLALESGILKPTNASKQSQKQD